MKISVGYVLWVLAVVITATVVAAKYFGFTIPTLSSLVMRDPAQSLLVALACALVSKWT